MVDVLSSLLSSPKGHRSFNLDKIVDNDIFYNFIIFGGF